VRAGTWRCSGEGLGSWGWGLGMVGQALGEGQLWRFAEWFQFVLHCQIRP